MKAEISNTVNQWLNSSIIEEADKQQIRELIQNDHKELEESFYCNLDFGTGGLRGIMGIGTNRMNKYTVGIATQGLANYLIKVYPNTQISAVIARDSRNNSDFFADIVASIFTANNIKTYTFDDIRPTPLLSFAVRELQCHVGVMLTASHNPKEYNGYKVYWKDGGQLISPHDANVIKEVNKIQSFEDVNFQGNDKLKIIIKNEIDEKYYSNILTLRQQYDIIKKQEQLKIVYTPLHGTGYKIIPEALRRFGFQNIIETEPQNIPDGNFPTVKSPNPEEKDSLKLAILKAKETHADILLATDPDADRIGIGVKNTNGDYVLLNGNETASLITYYLLSQTQSKAEDTRKKMIVKTIVTTDLLNKIASKFKFASFEVLTGFKYIAEIIELYYDKYQFICGGEESYGFLAGDFVRDKDAVITACLLAEITAWSASQNKSLLDILIDIAFEFGFYKEKLISLTKKGISGMQEISDMMENYRNNYPKEIINKKVVKILDYQKSIEHCTLTNKNTAIKLPKSNVIQYILEDETKITMRPSGTEPKIKYYFSVNTNLESKEIYEATSDKLEEKLSMIISEMNLSN